jgi:hypothetical protein
MFSFDNFGGCRSCTKSRSKQTDSLITQPCCCRHTGHSLYLLLKFCVNQLSKTSLYKGCNHTFQYSSMYSTIETQHCKRSIPSTCIEKPSPISCDTMSSDSYW